MTQATNTRAMLTDLGVGNFNATMVIQYMFIAPATTDPKSPPIMLLVKRLQQRLNQLGYRVPGTGYLDVPTANAITMVAGHGWQNRAWADVVRSVLMAPPKDQVDGSDLSLPSPPAAVGGLPDVPGGMLTYAAAAAAYYFLVHKKRR